MSREAMQMALEALESKYIVNCGAWRVQQDQAITALRQALEEKQEPVAWITRGKLTMIRADAVMLDDTSIPLYVSPRKQWVGLTDEEIQDLSYLFQKIDEGNAAWFDRWGFARAIEAKLKEKNHG